MPRGAATPPLEIGGVECLPGEKTRLELNVARLATGTWVSLPVTVLRGRRPGPSVWLSAAIHGDELNGVEIVRRALAQIPIDDLRGTVIGVPIVNVFGFLQQSRYLPDRRDLNRSFPGSARGSLASRLAHLFMTEIVDHCQYGLDFHTGAHHRTNLPQLRADLDAPEIRELAEAMRVPIAIRSRSREGSLRQVAGARGCRVLLFEAGETLRFDRPAIRLGVRCALRVLKKLGMLSTLPRSNVKDRPTRFVEDSRWVRASRSGILLAEVDLGDELKEQQLVGSIGSTFSDEEQEIRAPHDGIVIGLTTNPLVNRGDAVAHLARITEPGRP